MSSMRGAYKAKLREVASTASRRRSRGVERKNKRDNEINKRRLLSNDMSPVAEKIDVDNQRKPKRGQTREKTDTVLDRLKQWRDEKKRKLEQEKLEGKGKPSFKVSALVRESEAELYKSKSKTSNGKNKASLKKGKPTENTMKSSKHDSSITSAPISKQCKVPAQSKSKKTQQVEAKKSGPSTSKLQTGKPKDKVIPVTSKMQRASKSTADLASKLTVAAAAKRHASPKKFLRATRASTLQKKELAKESKGLKEASKSTGTLFSEETKDDVSTGENFEKQPSPFKPQLVPKILDDFDFSKISEEGNSVIGYSSGNSCDNAPDASFAGLPLKSRKSVRKSMRLAALEMCCEENQVDNNEDEDNLIVFTPALSKSRSVRKSKRLSKAITNQPKTPIGDGNVFETFNNSKNLVTPNSRKSNQNSKSLTVKQFEDLLIPSTNEAENIEGDIGSVSGSTNRAKRKSTRKSCVMTVDADDQKLSNFTEIEPPNYTLISDSIEQSSNLELSSKEKSPLCDLLVGNSVKNKNRRKSCRKSVVSQNIKKLSEVNTESKEGLENELSQEQDMETDHSQQTLDTDTQVSIDFTSTPKSQYAQRVGSFCKRQSLKNDSLAASSIEEINSSPDKIPDVTPKLRSRKSQARRRSSVLRRKSRSTATPAKTPRSGLIDRSNVSFELNKSGIENMPRRKSTVISVSDEGTAVGRNLELALAYTVEQVPPSAKASRILKELVIEKVEGERSFFEVSFDESLRMSQNNSDHQSSQCDDISSLEKASSVATSPFTPRKSHDVTSSSNSNSLVTPKSTKRTRHSVFQSSGFKEPGLPLSALRSAGRRKTEHSPLKSPEQMITILKKSPMIEMGRRRSKLVTSPNPPKGQYFRDLVKHETDGLNVLCNNWNDYLTNEPQLEENVQGQIRCAVGKALLLIEQRFKQFSGLVDNYVYDLGEKKTTSSDLQGFWDMIFFQVEDVNSLFKELDEMRDSNWHTGNNSVKAEAVLKLKKKAAAPKAKGNTKKVKSNFAAFRAEMMKKKVAQAAASLPAVDQDKGGVIVN